MLRTCTIADIRQEYIDALNDPAVVGLTEARHTTWNMERARAYVEKSNVPGESELIGIFLLNGKHIGNIRLSNFSEFHRRVELGMMIFDKTEWNKGYTTEALRAIDHYAFDILKLHRIQADYYAINKASAAVFKKAGYNIEGIFRDHFRSGDGYIDSVRVAKINQNV